MRGGPGLSNICGDDPLPAQCSHVLAKENRDPRSLPTLLSLYCFNFYGRELLFAETSAAVRLIHTETSNLSRNMGTSSTRITGKKWGEIVMKSFLFQKLRKMAGIHLGHCL